MSSDHPQEVPLAQFKTIISHISAIILRLHLLVTWAALHHSAGNTSPVTKTDCKNLEINSHDPRNLSKRHDIGNEVHQVVQTDEQGKVTAELRIPMIPDSKVDGE